MAFLSEEEKDTLSARIKLLESKTRAELVTVIAQQSDGYRYIPLLWAALIALSVPGVYFLYVATVSNGWVDAEQAIAMTIWLYPVQVLVFLGIGMLFQLPTARLWLIPQAIKRQRAARHAREQFFQQNLHQTRGRTGVLLFVSVAEHYVEIIVDSAVAEVVDNTLWEQTVSEFITHVRSGEIAAGFEHTIDACQDVLWTHFPADFTGDDDQPVNELPNRLIEV